MVHNKKVGWVKPNTTNERIEIMKNSKVLSLAGGGGSSLTANTRALARHNCHPELDSGSIQRDRKNVTLVRFRLGGRNDRIGITRAAFTMAEILLSLTIIGVVAAITLPSLTGNINERTWNTQRKALYARFSQAIALMPALNGYGTLTEESSAGASDAVDTAAETFVTDGLSKVLKINNICDSEHLADCGIVSNITTLTGSSLSMPATMNDLNSLLTSANYGKGNMSNGFSLLNTKAAAFETQNGESVAVYYQPNCIGSLQEVANSSTNDLGFFIGPKMCANFVYDLNGNKGPNTVGKDIGFITVLYPSDAVVVAPYPANRLLGGQATVAGASKACAEFNAEYRLPNVDELSAMFVNNNLLTGNFSISPWSSSAPYYDSNLRWFGLFRYGTLDDMRKNMGSGSLIPWCVKR